MRTQSKTIGGVNVTAIAGTYVVLLGMDATATAAKGLLGFAIQREDKTENEKYWLKGFRTFQETDPNPAPGSLVSTQEHPIQAFLWGDYTAKPNHKYIYSVVPVYGSPKNLKYGKPVPVSVTTENEDLGIHAIYFNRGVAGSQAYARKFGNKEPDEVPNNEAYKWLSRGLEEAMIAYIGQAKDKSYSLRACVYEFSWPPVLEAFAAAAKRGVDVKIVYDCRKAEPQKTSKAAIKKAGIGKLMIPRKANPSYITHNKFIVLLKNGKPQQVWTGSTNFTAGGIFGQSNVGHQVRDPKVADQYLTYWGELSKDTPATALRKLNLEQTPDPKNAAANGITPIFSPRPSLNALEWYASRMKASGMSLGFTAAFGVNKSLATVLGSSGKNLRYILLEKKGDTFNTFSKVKNNYIAIGAVLNTEAVGDGKLHRWLDEKLTNLNTFVKYLHTKYLFVDPLSDNPTVISGSANFSDASTLNNDENMLVIQGNTSVADIYLGEFMRLWQHYYFRDVAGRQASSDSKVVDSTYLYSDDQWTKPYYAKGTPKQMERLLFSMQLNPTATKIKKG